MNTDDLLCIGCVDNILLSSTIGRNKNLIPGEVLKALISGTEEVLATMRDAGVGIISTVGLLYKSNPVDPACCLCSSQLQLNTTNPSAPHARTRTA